MRWCYDAMMLMTPILPLTKKTLHLKGRSIPVGKFFVTTLTSISQFQLSRSNLCPNFCLFQHKFFHTFTYLVTVLFRTIVVSTSGLTSSLQHLNHLNILKSVNEVRLYFLSWIIMFFMSTKSVIYNGIYGGIYLTIKLIVVKLTFHRNHVPIQYDLLYHRSKAEKTGVFNACLFGLNPKYFFMRSTRA